MQERQYASATERFLKYVSIDTQSDPHSEYYPSTEGQKKLLSLLRDELVEMGVSDVRQDKKYSCVYATIPSNMPEKTVTSIGFIAHTDTSDAISGKNIRARVIENFDGNDIVLNSEKNIVTKMSDFPEMKRLAGKSLIVTDGTTLLGADDKSGVTEIMEMAEYFCMHPEEKHGNICIAFTADEETGRGTDYFDIQGFGAHFAYTVDGDMLGDLAGENFNAADAVVTANGCSVHPGDAYGKMKNASRLLQEFDSLLPEKERPEHTRDREGFYHLCEIKGNVEEAVAEYIIRDHDDGIFEERKKVFMAAADDINKRYGEGTLVVKLEDSYYNMKRRLDPHPEVLDYARKAMEKLGIETVETPIRGGTDGARLSFLGLPCPNLGTGGGNFHGRHEFLCIEEMEQTIDLLKQIVREYAAE